MSGVDVERDGDRDYRDDADLVVVEDAAAVASEDAAAAAAAAAVAEDDDTVVVDDDDDSFTIPIYPSPSSDTGDITALSYTP